MPGTCGSTFDLDVARSLRLFGGMKPSHIDVGEMNGRIFLHKAVIGTIPAIAAAREEIRGDASLRARTRFYSIFSTADFHRPADCIAHRSNRRRRKNARRAGTKRLLSLIMLMTRVSAGSFQGRALDQGTLTVYILKRLSLPDIFRLTLEMLAGSWRHDSALVVEHVEGVVLQMKKQRVQVMIDGEVETLPTPFAFRIRPQALSILAPEADEDDDRASGAM